MTLQERFEKYDNLFLHAAGPRADLRAFNLLNKLAPGNFDIVCAAEHDEIWLEVDLEALQANATDGEIEVLVRCGVLYDRETDSLKMYV